MKRIPHPVTGVATTLDAIANEYGIPYDTVRKRVNAGLSGAALVARKRIRPGEMSTDIRRPDEWTAWQSSPVGRLSTRLMRDYAGGAQ